MITITADELAEILQVSKNLFKHIYIRHFTLTKYVRTIKGKRNRCTIGFILTPDSINALMQYLLKKGRSIAGKDELKEYYENMVKGKNYAH